MKAAAYVHGFNLDAAARGALEGAAITTARRTLVGTARDGDRFELVVASESVGGRECWRVVVDIIRPGAPKLVRGTALGRRPHVAIEEACLAAWEALRATAYPGAA